METFDPPRRIKDWPEEDRPREKLLARGADQLSDAELLAIVLRTGDAASQTSALDQARQLLSRFGGLRGLGAATAAEVCAIKGVGIVKAAQIQAVFAIAARLAATPLQKGAPYSCAATVFDHFRGRLGPLRKETFLVLMLDSKNRLLKEMEVSVGSLTASIVHPREVFAPVLRESAASVIFIHNHPSGDPRPSREDIEITARLRQVGELLGIRVLDHVIVGSEGYVSFADQGWMDLSAMDVPR
ncbi:MAG: DNA repair protein RadC [Deltaproteobacteria bacterium]|nr:DNA repair protein RadC [Deltaproteobacteria bacterium]